MSCLLPELYPMAIIFPSGLQAIAFTLRPSFGALRLQAFVHVRRCKATSPKKQINGFELWLMWWQNL